MKRNLLKCSADEEKSEAGSEEDMTYFVLQGE
jgi:hypothetical protein